MHIVRLSMFLPAAAFAILAAISGSNICLGFWPGSAFLWFIEIELRGTLRAIFEAIDRSGVSDPLSATLLFGALLALTCIAFRFASLFGSFVFNHIVLILMAVSLAPEISVTTALLMSDHPTAISLSFDRVMSDTSVSRWVAFLCSLVSCCATHFLYLRRARVGFRVDIKPLWI